MIKVSFCIPTFNRGSKVFDLVSRVLTLNSRDDFEIIVLDNCSTDNTYELLNSFPDSRLTYILNERPTIGPLNIINSLSHANGKYAFLCLDKDSINPIWIDKLIDFLNIIPEVSFGFCELDLVSEKLYKTYTSGFESLFNMAYLSAHPSGMFYRTKYFRNLNFQNILKESNKIFGFYPDVINAEMSLLGPSIKLSLPLFSTESLEDCEHTTSYTFKLKKDLFFTPQTRSNNFIYYSNHLFSLKIPFYEKYSILKKIFRSELLLATFGFRSIMKNKPICSHYYLSTRNVSLIEILYYDFVFCVNFLINNTRVNFLLKIYVCISQNLYLIFSTLTNKFRR